MGRRESEREREREREREKWCGSEKNICLEEGLFLKVAHGGIRRAASGASGRAKTILRRFKYPAIRIETRQEN